MKIVALLLVALLAAADGSRWWSYVEFLASDDLQGRNTGSEGHRKAANFIAAQFERDGLRPAGEHGYIQPVRFRTLHLNEAKSSLSLVKNGREQNVRLGEDALISTRVEPAANVSADLVFVGYGLRVPEKNYDDFAGLDTRGKIMVYISGGPGNIPGALASHYQTSAERWKTMRSLGIVGGISVANPRHMDVPWARTAANRTQVTMQLADPQLGETEGQQIQIAWNPAHAEDLLEGSGHTLPELIDSAEAGKPLPRFPLRAGIKAKTALDRADVESQNVAAIYPGSDAALKNEYVAISAHLDHLGVGEPVNGDSIFNGAMDNASGVASMLELAARFRQSAPKLKRSVLFVAVTGEEKGLLGSKYFAARPTVPQQAIVADINSDMFLPLFPLKLLTVYGLDESSLGDDVRSVAASMGIEVQPDPEPRRNIFIRSDQYSFVIHGVPSLMMDFGTAKGSKEEQVVKEWLRDRYHAPSDDLNQPVDRNAANTFNDLMEKLIVRVAGGERKPAWKTGSFFRRYAPGQK